MSIRGFFLAAAVAAALLILVSGCGGSDDSSASSGEVTVETGSLSKADFIKRADGLCATTRQRFLTEYSAFEKKVQTQKTPPVEDVVTRELVDSILLPHYEKLIDEIASLGAPSAGSDEVVEFLDELQARLSAIQAKRAILAETATPFAKSAKIAKTYGLVGCAESLNPS